MKDLVKKWWFWLIMLIVFASIVQLIYYIVYTRRIVQALDTAQNAQYLN